MEVVVPTLIPIAVASDDDAKTSARINDDRHQWGWIGQGITGDPRVYRMENLPDVQPE